MADPMHTHYDPYGPPRQVPGTLLDCTPESPSDHKVEDSELWADYMYSPRLGPESDTGLPSPLLDALKRAYMHTRAEDTQWVIADIVTDEKHTYRVRITNRTMYHGDGPDWHTEEWGLSPVAAQWVRIGKNPHPGYDHTPPWCPNCGY